MRRFRVDAPLPASGPARLAVIAMLVLGGLVAVALPVLIALFFYAAATSR